MRIGVISDTHGFLDPKVHKFFAGVSHILHGGDIGPDAIIAELRTIAPVTAVLGNTDSSRSFQLTEMVTVVDCKFLLHHIVDPHGLKEELRAQVARFRPDAVIFGHTHKAFCKKIDEVTYLNPGYSGKPKPGAERSVAILHYDGAGLWHEFFAL